MISPAVSTSASQAPRVRVAPNRRSRTYGDLAADFAANYGLTPDPWQQLVLEDWLRERNDKWASLTCGLSVPRQNGKNGALEVRELFGMVGRGEKILHTAHQVKTAQKHFRRLKQFFGRKVGDPGAKYPELNQLVSEIRNVNGQEAIYLANGASVEIVARSTGSGRGFTADVIVCDEAQDMSDEDQEALLSTTSAAPLGNPQWIYTGTPPGPKVNGQVFRRIRDAALGDSPGRRCWHEWSAPPGEDRADRDGWARVNPGLVTGRLLWDVVEGEFGEMSPEGFDRERRGMWSEELVAAALFGPAWGACESGSIAVPIRALGLHVAPEGASAAISGGGSAGDLVAVKSVSFIEGSGWAVGEAVALYREHRVPVVVDSRSEAAALVKELRTRGVRVVEASTRDCLDAWGDFSRRVKNAELAHPGTPELNDAACCVKQKFLGDRALWDAHKSGPLAAPLIAAALAAWQVTKKAPPPDIF